MFTQLRKTGNNKYENCTDNCADVRNGGDVRLQNIGPARRGVTKDEGFMIAVPRLSTRMKQGETRSVEISLKRGSYFKQDVDLRIDLAQGLTVDPTSITIKAADKPELLLRVTADHRTPIGQYRVSIVGTPKLGESTSAEFNVKVTAP